METHSHRRGAGKVGSAAVQGSACCAQQACASVPVPGPCLILSKVGTPLFFILCYSTPLHHLQQNSRQHQCGAAEKASSSPAWHAMLIMPCICLTGIE